MNTPIEEKVKRNIDYSQKKNYGDNKHTKS